MKPDVLELAPPASHEAEQAVLGCCIVDRRALEIAEARLKPHHFYWEAHRVIFRAMLDLYQDGAVDLRTLHNRLIERGLLDSVGGITYVADMADMVPSTANVADYCEIVRQKALRRDAIEAAHDVRNWAYDEGMPTADVLARSEARIQSIAELRGADVPDQDAALDELAVYLNTGRAARIPFYLETVNDYMNGGMMRGFFTAVGADPGIGKTRMLVRDIYAHVLAGRSVHFFSLEIPRPEIEAELMALHLGINRDGIAGADDLACDPFAVVPGSPEFARAAEVMRQWPLRIYDGGIDAEDMEPIVRRAMHKGPVDVVHVDYAGLVSVKGARGAERMEDVSQRLSDLYRRCKVTGIVLCHVSKDGAEVHPWYSRKLEQDCQAFWYIPKPDAGSLAETGQRFEFRNQKNRYARRSRDVLNVGWDNDQGFFKDLPTGQRGAGM